MRPDFLLVHEAVADRFLALLKSTITEFYGADPQRTEWLGRCVNANAFQRLEGLIKGAADKIYSGGRTDANDRYIEPTVLDYGTDLAAFSASEPMQDEIFGPILPVARFSDLEQVINLIKELPTGKPLSLYCYSRDRGFNDAIKRRTTSGGLCINDSVMHLANHELPFGGVGPSGMGSYHGHRSFLAFTHEKAVLEKSPLLDESVLLKPLLAARFPPYTPLKQKLIALFSMRFAEMAVNIHRHTSFWLLLVAYTGYAVGLRVTWE